MERKLYIAPECEVIEMDLVNMIAASTGGPEIDVEGDRDEIELGSNRHRGEWGNLWSNIK